MGRERNHLSIEGRYNKGDLLLGDAFNAFLNYMIAILVTDTFHDGTIEFRDHLSLMVNIDNFKCLQGKSQDKGLQDFGVNFGYLLDDSAAIHLKAQLQDVACKLTGKLLPLSFGSMLKKLRVKIMLQSTIPKIF